MRQSHPFSLTASDRDPGHARSARPCYPDEGLLHLGGIVHGAFRHSYLLYASDLPSWDDVVGGRNLALIWDHEFLDMAVV